MLHGQKIPTVETVMFVPLKTPTPSSPCVGLPKETVVAKLLLKKACLFIFLN